MNVQQKINDAALSELASEVILMYPAGAEFRTEDVLAAHPDLAASRRSVIKVSFEEYCRRIDDEESVEVSRFVDRFPEIESSLRAQINVHSMLVNNPEQLERLITPDWPVPDSQFLDWRLRRLIGRGGFSRVYLADEIKVGNRPVALKLTTRVGHECELIGKLQHPGICQILSVRDDDPSGVTAVAMPYHGDATLHDLIESTWDGAQTRATSQLPQWGPAQSKSFVDAVTTMAVQLCDALEFAHQNDVLHCDLKPSNVLLKSDGSPVLLDFNLAFSLQSGTRVLGGTVGYMSPEQISATLHRGEGEVDARTDVFGLGAVLYHVLSGAPAFLVDSKANSSDRLETRLDAICLEPPAPLSDRNQAVGTRLSRLVNRCLEADPALRPQSIGEVKRALVRLLPAAPMIQATGIAKLRPRGISGWAMVVALLLAAVVPVASPFFSRGDRARDIDQALDIDREIARLEAISTSVIAPEERELLGFYYCLTENWLAARDVYEQLIADGYRTVSILHNLACCRGRLGENFAQLGFVEALELYPEEGASWAMLAYYDAMQSFNELRSPHPDYLPRAQKYCGDDEMLERLTQYVELVKQCRRECEEDPNLLTPPSLADAITASHSFGELMQSHGLIQPSNLPNLPFHRTLAAN